jgi:integrase
MDRSKDAALRQAEKMAADLARQGSITIGDALDAWIADKARSGVVQSTLDGARQAVAAYFDGSMGLHVCRLNAHAAQTAYAKLMQTIDPRTGRQIAVATHRSYLSRTKSWARWVVGKGWLKGPSPLEQVQGIGRKNRGKAQLSIDQTRQLIITCTEHATRGDDGATATLMTACMALRASEAVSRTVADLDDGGRLLRVGHHAELGFRTKNASSVRTLEIPPSLRPILAMRAAGKAPTDPLFPSRGATGRRCRKWLYAEVSAMCKLAGVPAVCPHSLRGSCTTAAAARGIGIDLIADFVGHTSPTMTLAHYVQPGVAEAAQLARGQVALAPSLPS